MPSVKRKKPATMAMAAKRQHSSKTLCNLEFYLVTLTELSPRMQSGVLFSDPDGTVPPYPPPPPPRMQSGVLFSDPDGTVPPPPACNLEFYAGLDETVSTSLIPRLQRSRTRALKLCRREEPGIFFIHVSTVKGREGGRETLTVRGHIQRLRA